ncbi:helix-turn-helix transcriptional regulator [Roseobacter sinensis]|uniref:Shikimate kinase n=1 Tax=Roseobacter sinensis TaxID=2931391 RepID=A0ABT3BDV4_9RHOB|nr:helix-turn-helix transcriptional regulator [Roseobacter sp. WL0113]MCV3271759.1 helix-turn-helix transcriptional regulator [Roseobacter sp. WL0113]
MTETPLAAADRSRQLKERVAARVRSQRKAQKLPRRVLSDRSGVSPRYLAQLEAGAGNISIALLHRIAVALDVPIESFLSEDAPEDREIQRIASLYRDAPQEVQREVRRLLAPQNPALLRAGRICLIGLRGAGKSTLGKLASEALGLPFVELNREIEQETGMPLAEVMAFYGQDGYRALEADAVSRVVATHDRLILAVAGGLVTEEPTYQQVLERFHTIWLRTSAAEHMRRVRAQGDLRPMRGNPAAMEQLQSLLEARSPLYERADADIDTSNRTVKGSLNDLIKLIAARGFLNGAVG